MTALVLFAGFCCFASPARAQYQFDVWNTETGLPQNFVKGIVQTRDGYIWLTTSDGLVRFDGVRFTVFQRANSPGLTSNRLTLLFEDHQGNLWIGSEDHGIFRYRDGQFTNYTTADGLSDYIIGSIREDPDHNLYVFTSKGIDRWADGKFVPHDPGSETLMKPSNLYAYSTSYQGFTFADAEGLHSFEGGLYRTYGEGGRFSSRNVRSIYEDQYGAVWLGVNDRQAPLYRLKDGTFTPFQLKGLPDASISAVCGDRAGNIWIATGDGHLSQYRDGRLTTYGAAEGLSVKVTRIFEDREGHIWLGSDEGLLLARKKSVKALSVADGLSSKNAYLVYQDREGNIWLGTQGGSLDEYRDGRFTHYTKTEGLPSGIQTALFQDRDGAIWVGTYHSGVARLKDGKFTTYYSAKDGLASDTVLAIHQDREGTLWFGTDQGLTSLKDGRFTSFGTREGLAHPRVQMLMEDRAGNLWVGTVGGISRYRDGRFTSYTEQDGLSSGHVRAIYEDADGVLWIGTYDGGLNRFKDGVFTNYSTQSGLYSNGVFQILEDGSANLWMSSNQGIFRVSRRELNDFAEGRTKAVTSVFFDKKDGMLSNECNGGRQPAGWRMRDGRLWFPTQDGVAIIDPESLRDSPQPPKVVIEDYLVDNKLSQARVPLVIAPGQENLQIRYTGLSFTRPQAIRFKYKLIGLDQDWVDAGNRRAAYYSHLPPGEYTFTVIAANSDGVWTTEEALIRVTVRPPFWRTWWFLALAVAGLVGAGVLVYEYRVLRLKKARAAQEAFSRRLIESQETERKRIAAELHDSLGQSLAIIKNRAALSLSQPNDHEKAIEQLDEISTAAVYAIDEVREIAYNLRPYQLDRLGLTRALETMLERAADTGGIRFTVEIDEIDNVFEKESEINLYRIVQESVGNILKHSGASAARVALKKSAREVVITIQDNGRGFNPDASFSTGNGRGGFGLFGISERVRMMRGQHTLNSAPGAGTILTIRFDLKEQRGRANGNGN